jgi:hypothetical protein
MAWQDRLANWADGLLQRLPGLDHWSEKHFHAIGLHGPEVRHLLKTRFFPAAVLVSAALALLVVSALLRRRSARAARA